MPVFHQEAPEEVVIFLGLSLKNMIRIWVSIVVSAAIVVWMISLIDQGLDPADRPRLLGVLSNSLGQFILLYVLSAFAQGIFRAKRFHVLISADPETRVPTLFHTYLATAVRNMTVDLLPARLGELSYVVMMNRGYRVAARTCISSLAISFVFDLIALLVIVTVLIAAQLVFSHLQPWLLSIALVLLVLIACGLLVLFAGLNWVAKTTKRAFGPAESRPVVMAKLIGFVDDLAEAMTATRRFGVFARTFWLSMGTRVTKYAGLYFLFKAVVIPNFAAFADIPLFAVLTALISAEGAASTPVPAFMSFGTYEAGGAMTMIALGFDQARSMLTMLAIHIWSQFIDYSIGALAFVVFILTAARPGAGSKGESN